MKITTQSTGKLWSRLLTRIMIVLTILQWPLWTGHLFSLLPTERQKLADGNCVIGYKYTIFFVVFFFEKIWPTVNFWQVYFQGKAGKNHLSYAQFHHSACKIKIFVCTINCFWPLALSGQIQMMRNNFTHPPPTPTPPSSPPAFFPFIFMQILS